MMIVRAVGRVLSPNLLLCFNRPVIPTQIAPGLGQQRDYPGVVAVDVIARFVGVAIFDFSASRKGNSSRFCILLS